jgi:hypothetical protein
MAGPTTGIARQDSEFYSYTLVTDGSSSEVAQRVKAFGLGTLLAGLTYDYISAAYPAVDTEVYTYKTGGAGGTTVATLTVVYTSSAKTALSSVTKS